MSYYNYKNTNYSENKPQQNSTYQDYLAREQNATSTLNKPYSQYTNSSYQSSSQNQPGNFYNNYNAKIDNKYNDQKPPSRSTQTRPGQNKDIYSQQQTNTSLSNTTDKQIRIRSINQTNSQQYELSEPPNLMQNSYKDKKNQEQLDSQNKGLYSQQLQQQKEEEKYGNTKNQSIHQSTSKYSYLTQQNEKQSMISSDNSSLHSNQLSSQIKSQYSDIPKMKKSNRGLVGLRNIGNTCFMNSILQSLFNTPGFNQFFLERIFMNELKSKNKGIAEAFAELLNKVFQTNNSGAESTYNLKRAIENISHQFTGYSQQDAQEFLRTILDGLHEDLNRVDQKPAYKELQADISNQSLQKISEQWFEYYKKRDDSLIQDLFCGQLLNKVTCNQCSNVSIAFDNFLDLSLCFSRGQRMVQDCDIYRLFDFFLQEELLDDTYYCTKCKKPQKSKRQFSLWKLPEIFVIHLKRFYFARYRKEKIENNIIFPIKGLDLSQFVQQSKDKSVQNPVYDLCAIVNHYGSLSGGHYYAECKNMFDQNWYEFNDSTVSDVNSKMSNYEKNGSSYPYLLFYYRRNSSIIKTNQIQTNFNFSKL